MPAAGMAPILLEYPGVHEHPQPRCAQQPRGYSRVVQWSMVQASAASLWDAGLSHLCQGWGSRGRSTHGELGHALGSSLTQ